jgi:hypothetical protein
MVKSLLHRLTNVGSVGILCNFQLSFWILLFSHLGSYVPLSVSLFTNNSHRVSEFLSIFRRIFAQLVKIPFVYEMQRHITVFMKASRWTLFSASWFPSTPYIILVYVKVLIWIFHLRINVDSGCWTEMQNCALLYLLYARHIWSLSHWSSEWELLFLSDQIVFPLCNNGRRAESLSEMLCSSTSRKPRTKLLVLFCATQTLKT